MALRTRRYEQTLSAEHRLRVTLETERGQVLRWAVQLEWLDAKDGWVWLARYDNAGGKAHRDRNRIAQHEAVALPAHPGWAIEFAREDLASDAQAYTDDYLAAKAAGKEGW